MKLYQKVVTGIAGLFASAVAMAQANPAVTAATDGIAAAQSDGLTVGGAIIAMIAAFLVIFVVASMLKKR